MDKLRHVVFIEDAAGLFTVRVNVSDGNFRKTGAGNFDEFDVVRGSGTTH
jgi:hypothetical protein